MIKRSLTNKSGDSNSAGMGNCPDVLELESGDFAVVGIRSTAAMKPYVDQIQGCGPDEEIVVVPRAVIQEAISNL